MKPWQQPDPAYRPAIKKLNLKGYISVHTPFNNVCTFPEMNVAIFTQHISCTYLDKHVCKEEIGNKHACTLMYMVCTCEYKLKHLYTCINMHVHFFVLTCTYTSEGCTYINICVHTLIHTHAHVYTMPVYIYVYIFSELHVHAYSFH